MLDQLVAIWSHQPFGPLLIVGGLVSVYFNVRSAVRRLKFEHAELRRYFPDG